MKYINPASRPEEGNVATFNFLVRKERQLPAHARRLSAVRKEAGLKQAQLQRDLTEKNR
jgi:hypothetical protein